MEKDSQTNTRPSTKDKMDKMVAQVSSWELQQQRSNPRLSKPLSFTSSISQCIA